MTMIPLSPVADVSLDEPWRAILAVVADGFYLGLFIFMGFVVVRALTRKTVGWIMASTVCGLFLLAPGLLLVTAAIMGGLEPKPSHPTLSPHAPLTSPTSSSPQTVRGSEISYHLTLPADWNIEQPTNAFDILATHRQCTVGVIAEEASMGTSDAILNIAQKNLQRTATTIQLSDPSTIQIDGRNWLTFTARCQIKTIACTYQFCVYSGPEGTFQIAGWTTQNQYERNAKAMRDIALTFRFPVAALAVSTTPTPEVSPQTVQGHLLAYSLTLPAGWAVRSTMGAYDLLVKHRSAYVGVIAEEGALSSSAALLKQVQSRLRKSTLDPQLGPTNTVKIDGRDWLSFTSKQTVDDVPFGF